MENEVTASWDTLMRQAPDTADFYLGKVIEYIDNRLGELSSSHGRHRVATLE